MNADVVSALSDLDAPPGLTDDIPGWLTGDEAAALYALGLTAPGPVLEVGPWLGRSTVCIAKGIVASKRHKSFTTCELNPTGANWAPADADGVRAFLPVGGEPSLGGTSVEDYDAEIGPVVEHPAGVIGQLQANLRRAGVDRLVTVAEGDFRFIDLPGPFGFIFSDAMHSPEEVHRNAPRLVELLAPGGILACHDTTPENREALGEHLSFGAEVQVDSLFVGAVLQ